jgi:5-enolpyruvylshikimate-3-phosphate synthase
MVLEALSKMEKMAESSVRLKDQLALRDKEVDRLTAQLANHELKQKQVR